MPVQTTTYEYDPTNGDLLRSTTVSEPAWTEQDAAEILALALYRSWLCPLCGNLVSECTSHHETGPQFTVSRIRCRATDELIMAQEADGTKDRPGAMLTSVSKKESSSWRAR